MKKTGTFFLKKDNLKLGLVLGLITPLIILVIIYFVRSAKYEDFSEFLRSFTRMKQLITFWGVWCLVGNIALFTYYINTGKDKTALGIFVMSVIYGIGVLLLKVFI